MNLLEKITEEISDCFDYDEDQVEDRLVKELFETGHNVRQAAKDFRITAHQYDDKMEEFYRNTDAFVFEGIIDNEKLYRKLISNRIIEIVEKQFCGAKHVKILDLGAGVGSDCINLVKSGYTNIIYFEFDGPSCKFAKYRFDKYGIASNVEIINELYKIPKNCFDIVISIEVLEHVKDPKGMVKELHSYLKKEGIAIITESFNRVGPDFPTHLKSNLPYSGRTISLFESQGSTLLDGYLDFRPLIFAKGLALEKKVAYYFNGKLFRLRFEMLYERFRQIVKRHILS